MWLWVTIFTCGIRAWFTWFRIYIWKSKIKFLVSNFIFFLEPNLWSMNVYVFLVSFDCETLGLLFLLSQTSNWYIIYAISLFKLGVIKFLNFRNFSCLKIQEKIYLFKLLCFTQIKLLDFVVYIYYSWYVASISVFWLNLVKIENSKIWVWTLEISFYIF